MIHKSATKAATIHWRKSGNRDVLWVGSNRNTGEMIIWNVTWIGGEPGRSRRVTGRNIAELASEIALFVPAEGTLEVHNAAAYAAVTA